MPEHAVPMDVSFRRATTDDLAAIVALLADDVLGRQREKPGAPSVAYQRAFAAIDADPRQLLVVADADGEVVGTLQLTFIPGLTYEGGERAQIEGVRIASTTRSEGLGRQMVGWAVDQARNRGCRLVQLTADKRRADAIRFYESLGFTATHEGMKLHL
jgi:ribosomal protein S18 acetylase RimI-like enzyme